MDEKLSPVAGPRACPEAGPESSKEGSPVYFRSVLLAIAPVAADAVALIVLLWWLRPLAQRLQEQSGLNVMWLGGGYVLLCLGVYALRKLEAAQAGDWLDARTRGALGALFGLAMMTAVAWQLGFFDVAATLDPMALGEGEAASFFVFAPSAWLGLSLFYVIVLAFNVTPAICGSARSYPWLALAGLLGVNAMLLLATAQLRAIRATGIITGHPLLWFAAAFIILLFLFAPPRLFYLARQPRLSAAVTFLILLASCAWWIAM